MAPILFLLFLYGVSGYKLKQVLILSRHNLRTPLDYDLQDHTRKPWPKWTVEPGILTARGEILESYMADYFSTWINQNKLFTGCPDSNSTIIYANSIQRTLKTAEVFARNAFPLCNITVEHKDKYDQFFYPLVKNNSKVFKRMAVLGIQKKIDEFDLTEAYKELNNMLDLAHSVKCFRDRFCDLTAESDIINIDLNNEPKISGPLFEANRIVDTFLMQYYNNKHLHWNEFNDKKMRMLTVILKAYLTARFKTEIVANDVTKTILKYIANTLKDDKIKFTLLVGHDSTQNAVLTALKFKPYVLPDQYEITPIGGKIVFQKWTDEQLNKDLLKVEYFYLTTEQICKSVNVSKHAPLNSVKLQIENCDTDSNGFCLWSYFENIIKKYLD